LSQAETCPYHRLHCRGTHSETRQRWITERDSQGRTRSRQESYSETVVDFDFCIDISPQHSAANKASVPVQWSVGDEEPAYRGRMVREYEPFRSSDEGSQTRRKTAQREVKRYKNWVERRTKLGFPPWVREEDVDNGLVDASSLPHSNGLRSSKTIREWADDYCASPKYLKEFVYEKVSLYSLLRNLDKNSYHLPRYSTGGIYSKLKVLYGPPSRPHHITTASQ